MPNILKPFLDNLFKGALNPKGNLADYQHGQRLFVDDSFRLAPKQKFLYHVSFNINSRATAIIPNFNSTVGEELNMLVKSVDLPKYTIDTVTKNQYNKKRKLQTRINYDPIQVVFHDDNYGITTAMWQMYYQYYFKDGNYGKKDQTKTISSTVPPEYNRGNTISGDTANKYRYGMDSDSFQPFFTSIQIFQLSRKTYQCFTLVNPKIVSFQHDNLQYAEGATTTQNTMSLIYEGVVYGVGAVKQGIPTGFGTEYYDNVPSPLSILGGGTASLFGQGGVLGGVSDILGDLSNPDTFTNPGALFGTLVKGANTFKNAKALTGAGLQREGFSIAKSAITAVTGVDVSGVANVAFPKEAGRGQNQTTSALAPKESVRPQSLTASEQSAINDNPVALSTLVSKATTAGVVPAGPNAESQVKALMASGRNLKLNSLAQKVVADLKG